MDLLVACIAIAIAAAFVSGYKTAASPVRPDRFAQRYAIALDPASGEYVARYLARVRRWRLSGVLVALILSLAVSSANGPGVSVNFAGLLVGWLVGAAVAEIGTGPAPAPLDAGAEPPDGDVSGPSVGAGPIVAPWVRLVPLGLAVAAAVSTALALVLSPRGLDKPPIVWLGIGALACAAAVAIAYRGILSRHRAAAGSGSGVDRAVRASAIGWFGAAGILLAGVCLVSQADTVRAATVGPVAEGIGQAEVACGIGVLLMAVLLARAGRPVRDLEGGWIGPAATRRPRLAVSVVVLAVLVSTVSIGRAWLTTLPPYPVSAVHPTATVRFTDDGSFARDTAELGITGLGGGILAADGQAEFVGRVDFAVPPGAHGGKYYVVVIDSRTNVVVPMLFGRDGSGWDGVLYEVPRVYPWLSAMAPIVSGSGYTDTGMAVWSDPDASTPLVFNGVVADGGNVTPADLIVALVFVGDDNQIYWATRIPVST